MITDVGPREIKIRGKPSFSFKPNPTNICRHHLKPFEKSLSTKVPNVVLSVPGREELLAGAEVVHAGLPPGGGVVVVVLREGGRALRRRQLFEYVGQALRTLVVGPGGSGLTLENEQ
jgi:hypothetical protein